MLTHDIILAFGKLRLWLVGFRLHFLAENRQSRTAYGDTICSPQANVNLIGKFPLCGNSPKHFALAKYIVPQGISYRRYITLAKRAYHATSAEVATP